MEKKVVQEKVFLPVKRQYYTFDEYGVLLLDEDFLKDSQEAREEMVVSGFYRPENDEDDGEVEADADDVPEAEQESVDPSDWQFDDVRQDVKIGGKMIHFQGGTQYRLLKYAANGGTDLQEAWRVAWEYESPADWRIMKSMEKRINEKLSKVVGLVVVFKVTSKKIGLYTLENKG